MLIKLPVLAQQIIDLDRELDTAFCEKVIPIAIGKAVRLRQALTRQAHIWWGQDADPTDTNKRRV